MTRIRQGKQEKDAPKHLINEAIRAYEVFLIDENGNKIGSTPKREAISMAKELGLDLVVVGGKPENPVCKIMDYGQLKYELKKRKQKAKKKQAVVKIKELKMRPKIDIHDFNVKLKRLNEFIDSGYKVKLVIRFRGREVMYAEDGKEILYKLYEEVKDKAIIEAKPQLNKYFMIMVLAPGSEKK